MAIDSSGATTWVRVPWYAAVSTHLAGLVVALAVLVVVVLATPSAAVLRRLRSRPRPPGAEVRWVVWASALTAPAATVVWWALGVLALAAGVAFVAGYHLVGWQFT